MPLPRSSGNNRHGAMQGLRRGVVVGLFGRKPALSAPSPFLGLGLCYSGGGTHVHKASTRRCTPLGHITLYNVCQGWHIQHERLVREKPYDTVSRSVIFKHCLFQATGRGLIPSLQEPISNRCPYRSPILRPQSDTRRASTSTYTAQSFPAFIFSLDVIVKFGEP